jgi:type II secretory pathway component GspD/PulD (secretin)
MVAAFMAFAVETSEIDLSQLRQTNPFAQFAGIGAPATKERPEGPKPDLYIETVSLKFVDAKSLKASIENMSSDWGNMEPDAKGNSLIICDTNDNLPKILAQIRKIDRKPEQIMIEVVILDVKLNDETEIGINWDMLTNTYRDAVYRQNLSFTSRVGSTASSNISDATAYNSTNKGADFWLLSGDIRNVIHVLQEKNNVEILASPRVMVVSGQKASIEAVEEIPYQEQSDTSGGGSLTSIKFKNVGVTLNVGATLTDDKFIFLDVEADQKVRTGTAVVVGSGSNTSSVPIVDARIVKSSLLLNDSQILVIGGLRRKETQKETNQIPFLGDIPLVGLAFKSTDTTESNSELLVILSPHIYKGEKPTDAEMAKYDEITKRPLVSIPENERQKDKKNVDKKSNETKKVKSKTKDKK